MAGILAWLLGLAAAVLAILGVFGLLRPDLVKGSKGAAQTPAEVRKGGCAVIVLAALLAGLSACATTCAVSVDRGSAAKPAAESVPDSQTGPKSVRSATKTITKVERDGATLRITVHLSDDTSSELQAAGLDNINRMAAAAERIGRTFQKGVAEDISALDEITLVAETDGVDRLGNKGDLPLVALTFTAADIRAAKYDNLTAWSVLNLADSLLPLSKVGDRELADYCSNKDQMEASEPFCRKVLGVLELQAAAGG